MFSERKPITSAWINSAAASIIAAIPITALLITGTVDMAALFLTATVAASCSGIYNASPCRALPSKPASRPDPDNICPQHLIPIKRRGEREFAEENFLKAAKIFTEGIARCPNQTLFYGLRADAYVMADKPELAIADWTSALKIKPNKGSAYMNRGRIYDSQGKDLLATADYKRAVALGIATAYKDLARVYERSGQLAQAVESLSKVIPTLGPLEAVPFYFDRSRLYKKLGKTAEANKDSKMATELLNSSGARQIDKYPNRSERTFSNSK